MNTITIGGQPVARSVAGALGRLELAVLREGYDADLRADVDFMRSRINAVEAQRDELVEALRKAAAEIERLNTFVSLVESEEAMGYWSHGELNYTKSADADQLELIARPRTGEYYRNAWPQITEREIHAVLAKLESAQ